MASSEKFCLKWNDFESNVSQAFCELRDEKDFFDVTLVCGDSQVSAHKVILAASSQFFRNILRANPHQHPLLYLRGVRHKELLSILSFMYKGQVNIAQEELSTFLSVAEDLKIKGLTQSHADTGPRQDKSEKVSSANTRSGGMSDPVPRKTSTELKEDDDIVECGPETGAREGANEPITTHPVIAVDEHLALRNEYNDPYLPSQETENPLTDQEFVSLIQSKMFRVAGESAGVWHCSECSYSSKVKCNVSQHIEAKHIKHAGYYCFICNKTSPSKNAFRMHNKRNHEGSKESLYQ